MERIVNELVTFNRTRFCRTVLLELIVPRDVRSVLVRDQRESCMIACSLVLLKRTLKVTARWSSRLNPRGLDTRVRHLCWACCAPGSSGTGAFARDRKLALEARQATRPANRPPVQHKELYTGYQPYRSPQGGDR